MRKASDERIPLFRPGQRRHAVGRNRNPALAGEDGFLPEEHDYVKVLVALKHLTPVPEETKPAGTPAVQSPKRRSSSDSEVKTEDTHGS
ncbi:hypothetical protein ECZU08_00280 [Escherichia coli]|nr:hypothetical protein ECZU08_00280 [Escherichia coli]